MINAIQRSDISNRPGRDVSDDKTIKPRAYLSAMPFNQLYRRFIIDTDKCPDRLTARRRGGIFMGMMNTLRHSHPGCRIQMTGSTHASD